MRSIKLLLVVSFLFVATHAQARGLPDFTNLVEKNSKAVVNISTTITESQRIPGIGRGGEIPEDIPEELKEYFEKFFEGTPNAPEQFERSASGSGFVISSDGHVVTNHHVVEGASEVVVRLSDRREYKAEVIGSDKSSDIALLKITAEKLSVVKLGDSKKLKQGEWV